MTLAEFRDSIRRVLGADLPLGEVTRLSRYGFQARQAERYRYGRILLAGDAAHQFPATGIGINVGMCDAVNLAWKLAAVIGGWAPAGLLDTYLDEPALRRGAGPAPDPGSGGPAARAGPGRYNAPGTVRRTARRRAAAAPDRSAHRGHRPPLPAGRPGTAPLDRHLRTRPDPAHRPGHDQRGGAHAPGTARSPRPRRPPNLRQTAQEWQRGIDICIAQTDHRPADALLIRPDAYIAWAAATGEPGATASPTLRKALSGWFGTPLAE